MKSFSLQPRDYVSPGMLVILPDECFPNIIIGDKRYSTWRYSRKEIPHNRYVDKRFPGVGFNNRDEVHILYNTALKFKGKKALEIGCWLGWSACHLALGGVELDVIDPLLENRDFYESVSSCLEAANVLETVNLIPGYSPQKVEELAERLNYKWSLIFIDGNHEAPGPLNDAIACEELAAEDALILFHDLASPDVSKGLDYLKQKGWNTMVYQTVQIMGVAWRGNVEPVTHQPDPKIQWPTLPEHLKDYLVSGLSKGIDSKTSQGSLLLSQNHLLKAVLAFDKSLQENPENVTALLELGQLSLKLGDLQEAKQLFAKAVSLERRNTLAIELLARVLIDLKEYQEVTNILEHLVKIQPQNLSALSLLANCYRQIGKEGEATIITNHYREVEMGKKAATLPQNLSEKFIAKTKPKRILIINNLYPPQELGGYGRRICDFANVLGKRGHTIHALASDAPYLGEIKSPETNVTRELLLCGTYEELPPKYFADELEVKRVIAHNDSVIKKTIESYAPDVCLVGNIDLLTNSIFLPLLEKSIPVIHLLGFAEPGYPVECTPNSPLYYIGANSEYGRQGVIKKGYPLDEIGIVYPGAFIEQFQMCCLPNLDKLRIVFASLVLPYKGPQTLIEALAILHYAGIDFECSIAGDAPNTDFLNDLKNIAQTRGFDSKVHFLGYLPRKELIELFAKNNVLVFPSVWEEPFGRSQVEAMAAGLTLITSGTGGSAEIVKPGISGLTFPPRNAFALAEALMGLTKNPEKWQEMAIVGQMRAELFDIDRSIDFLEEKFKELLQVRDGDVAFLQSKYLPYLQEKLRLREINLIIFPDWSQLEESLAWELQEVIKVTASHKDKGRITLLIDNSNISDEDADLALSSVAINLLMEEDLDVSEGPEISIIGNLSQVEWQTLLSMVKGKITLENENQDGSLKANIGSLSLIELGSYLSSAAIIEKC